MSEVRVRNAPSPTGLLHIGSVRTFLYNFLFARKNKGKYILRIEDTDRTRFVPGSLEDIVQNLHTLGIAADEGPYWSSGVKYRGNFGPYIQSERLRLYSKYAGELLQKKAAYYCFCTPERLEQLRKDQEKSKLPPKYDKLCLKLTKEESDQKLAAGEKHVVRLNVPSDQVVEFDDLVYGKIKISTNDIDDQILIKSDGYPTYHLAVVVDDYEMKISHVIRANEWVPSTPKHILLYRAFGWPIPEYVHLPPVLSKGTGKKLAKREGDVSVKSFIEKGYLPDAIINFIAFQGWNPKTEQEIFSLEELIENFTVEGIHKAGAIFDLDKLDWFNGMYIRKMDIIELVARVTPFLDQSGIIIEKYQEEFLKKIISLERERLKKLSEIGERVRYFFSEPDYNVELLIWKKSSKSEILESLESAKKIISNLQLPISKQEIEKIFLGELGDKPKGPMLWPLRVALTGLEASPGPFEIIDAFLVLRDGKEKVLKRIETAFTKLR